MSTSDALHDPGSYYREDHINGGWEYVGADGRIIGDAIPTDAMIEMVMEDMAERTRMWFSDGYDVAEDFPENF